MWPSRQEVSSSTTKLRLNSRESVDWLIPTIRAISFLRHFLCSKAKICDLCSEVSCLYIRNTKIINLPESSKGDSFFVLPVSLFGATRPDREAKPRCFSWIRSYEKILLSAKLKNDTISLSATPINRRCGFFFRKVSPLSQRVKVRRVSYRGYPKSSTNLFLDARRNYSSQCST